ncbi:MAG: GNAT family N-acetyltransferase [Clostridiales bacterium]|nr:GNAT family N-acetyltransferase [Clostridiales bacterium]
MIRKATESDEEAIWAFVKRDIARNYFVALSLMKGREAYKDIYIEDQKGILFYRTSGNLQFINYGQASLDLFNELICQLEFNKLIGPQSMCRGLNLNVDYEGAIISVLERNRYHSNTDSSKIERLDIADLEAVEELYSQLFTGYPKVSYMKDKLLSHRGIGYLIKADNLMSVAQSDFGCLVVGVATDLNHQHQGYATLCLQALIEEMFKTHDMVYLQYDNPNAGRLYESLGFRPIDQVIHYKKR